MPHRTISTPRRRRVRSLLVVGAVAATLTACGGDDDAGTTPVAATQDETASETVSDAATPAYGLVSPEQAAELATDPNIMVIDVRTPEEYAEGHIEGATLVDFSAPDFADRVAELDPDQDYLVYCRSGNRSGQAVAVMSGLGFERIYDMDGGTVAYTAAGLPLTT